jgi:flagellar biosynthesis/type III secretory pathway protein FliH
VSLPADRPQRWDAPAPQPGEAPEAHYVEAYEQLAAQQRLLNQETRRRAYAEGFQAGRLSWMQELITRVVQEWSN